MRNLIKNISFLHFYHFNWQFAVRWLKSTVMIWYAPSNIWQHPITGHVKINSWSANETVAGKNLDSVFLAFHYCITNVYCFFFITSSFTKPKGLKRGKQFLPLIRHPSCYSYSPYLLDTTIPKLSQIM